MGILSLPLRHARGRIRPGMTATSLSAKLKSLGVKVGAREVPPPPPMAEKRRARFGIDLVLPGRIVANEYGECFVAEADYATDYLHGTAPLHAPVPLGAIARWARDTRIAGAARDAL